MLERVKSLKLERVKIMPEAKIDIFLSSGQNFIYCFKYQLCT